MSGLTLSGGGKDFEQLFFAIDEGVGVVGGDFEAMAVGDGVAGASFNTIAAENAAIVVDVVDLGIALRRADSMLAGIFSRLDVNAVRGTSRRAQKTGHALLEPVFVAT